MKRKILQTVNKPASLRMMIMVFSLVFLFACNKKEPLLNPHKNSGLDASGMTLAEAAQINEAKDQLKVLIKDHPLVAKYNLGSDKPVTPAQNGNKRSSEVESSGNPDVDYFKFLVKRSINANDYECDRTIINDYIDNSVQYWDANDFDFYFSFSDVAFYWPYIFVNNDGGQSYGNKGQFTNAINRTYKDLKRFWNIPKDILMRDAHGNIFKDVSKVQQVLTFVYGYTEDDAKNAAGLCKTVFGSTHFYRYKHPLITFNAFASEAIPELGIPKKIVMGDGILEAYDDLGFEDVAPQAILSHEYGHQVQFAKGVIFDYTPEGTMYTELMADAFAGYYLTHKQGAGMNMKRVQEYLQVFYSIGDCAFDNPDHHGTPNQRMRAAKFGYNVAHDTKKQGKVLKAEDFILLFDAAYADITAPDA